MSQKNFTRWLALALAAATGCAPAVSKDEPVTLSSATLALFAPDSADPCNSVLPFPSDLAKDARTGRLNIPYCKADTADQTGIKTGLRTLDGYSLGVAINTRFSRPIDPTTVGGAALLVDTSIGQPVAHASRFDEATNTLYLQPTEPLKEATQYLVVITSALKDARGHAVVSDQVFSFAKSKEPLIDEQGFSRFGALDDEKANALEGLRLGFAPMFLALEAMGMKREEVAVAVPFTTQSVHASLPKLAGLVKAAGATVTHENSLPAAQHPLIAAAGIPRDFLCDVHTGRVALRGLLTSSGTFAADENGVPLTAPITVDYVLTTPNVDRNDQGEPLACTTEWKADKIVVFAHGLGRCKNDALALANAFAQAGWAVLSLDGPKAGARTVQNLGDRDFDGCPDQPATPEFIALPGTGPNPFAVRDHLREWGIELSAFVDLARNQPGSFGGVTAGGPAKVALVGHSWGGMAATLAGSVSTLDALAVNASSAELGAVFEPAIRATTAEKLRAAGVPVESAEGQARLALATAESVAAFRWAMEPGDPLFSAPKVSAQIPALVQVVSGGSQMPDANLHGTETQKRLARTFGRAELEQTTFEMSVSDGGTTAALCDSATGVVGALLKPCVAKPKEGQEPPPSYLAALAKTAGLQRQLVTFVGSALTGTAVVCNPDYTAPCK